MIKKVKSPELVTQLQQIPNIGVSLAHDLKLLGIDQAHQLCGQDPYKLYLDLCILTQVRQDPCVADVFIAAVRFMEGKGHHSWWHYTAERKQAWQTEILRNPRYIEFIHATHVD